MAFRRDICRWSLDMGEMTMADIDRLLAEWSAGDRQALEDLLPLVYEELRGLARKLFATERRAHTLQTTALVSEVYLRFRDAKKLEWSSRAQFFAFAGTIMRRILVDHARHHRTLKHGGTTTHIQVRESLPLRAGTVDLDQLLDTERALRRLERLDPRQARVVMLRYYSGLTIEETANQLAISSATVRREWTTAKRWLARELRDASKAHLKSA